jgi:hypothetical protein
MEMVTLRRDQTSADGTFGTMFYNGKQICLTCELPWDDNAPDASCIPAGNYQVIPHNSPDHPNTWEITGVPGRSGILIHNGNVETQSLGCILVGNSFGNVNGSPAVLNSVYTLNQLRQTLPSNFTITITGP